jgi:hypothetical protein
MKSGASRDNAENLWDLNITLHRLIGEPSRFDRENMGRHRKHIAPRVGFYTEQAKYYSDRNVNPMQRAMDRTRCKKYGIAEADLYALRLLQSNKCAICDRRFSQYEEIGSIDHCHSTGAVRGLLCTGCNTKLGWLEKHKGNVDEYLVSPPFSKLEWA